MHMRYALAGPRVLKTLTTLAAAMTVGLLLTASSALAWSTVPTTPASTTSSLNAVGCVGDTWTSTSTVSNVCYGWGSLTNASTGVAIGAGAQLGGTGGASPLGTYTLGSGNATIRGVDCAPISCVQVGENNGFGIATWSNLSVALAPAGAVTSRLNAVSCITGPNCLAVGSYTDSAGHRHGYAAVKGGAAPWSVIYQYQPTETQDSSLNGVSCVGPRCFIVGTHTGGAALSYGIALTYTWATGAVATATLPGGLAGQLNGISCVDNISQTKCEAVGSHRTTLTGPTIPTYVQTTFTSGSTGAVTYTTETGTPAAPAGATVTRLNGVSCYWHSLLSAFGCRVVGDSNSTGAVQPYVGTLTSVNVITYGATASATGTNCYDSGPSAQCWDVGTGTTTGGVTQAIDNSVFIP